MGLAGQQARRAWRGAMFARPATPHRMSYPQDQGVEVDIKAQRGVRPRVGGLHHRYAREHREAA
jgi:hypothetical protein